MAPLGFHSHDHTACIDQTLAAATSYCAENKLKFTPVRRRALEILLREHRALAAYDLLAHLAADGLGSQPPVAYRALDFLTSTGFAHKIERLNAYVACSHLGADHAPAFLICRACKAIAEAETDLSQGRLDATANAAGFQIERTIVEVEGLCPDCQDPRA